MLQQSSPIRIFFVHLSMSFCGSYTSSVNNVSSNINMGISIVAAAGNERDDACDRSPASAPGVITVASSAQGDYVSFFMNGVSCVNILIRTEPAEL